MTDGIGWQDVKIGSLGRVVTGKTPPSARPELFGEAHPFITPTDIDGVSRTVVTERFIAEEGASAFKNQMIPGGAVCFVCIGATIGKMCIATCRSLTNQQVNSIVVDEASHDPKYVFYALRQIAPDVKGLAGGAATPIISKSSFSDISIRVAPLQQQRRIASILSAYDDLIENNTRRIAILEEMARRVYEEWFVRFRYPGHEGVRMVESDLGPVPEGWRVTSLGDVAENHDRRRKPLSKMQRETFKGPYPYYGAAKIFDYVREYIFDGQFLLLAEDGSVETPEGFPVLQLTDGKFWPNNHTHILRGTDKASTEFLYLKLEQLPIRGYITGAAQPKLTQANINRIPVLLPTAKLMAEFTALIQPFFQLRASLLRASSNLRTTRDLLLPKLISGELDVSELPIPEAVAA